MEFLGGLGGSPNIQYDGIVPLGEKKRGWGMEEGRFRLPKLECIKYLLY